MKTPLERRLAELDAIPMREQFAYAYRAERARRHDRPEAADLDRHAFGRTTLRATVAAGGALFARERDDKPLTTPAERLAAKRERDSLALLFSGTKGADHENHN